MTAGPVCASPWTTVSALYDLTVNVTGLGFTHETVTSSAPTTVAVAVLTPTLDPSTHLAEAMPDCPTVTTAGDPGVIEPPPDVTENTTRAPFATKPPGFVTATRMESVGDAPGEIAFGGLNWNAAICDAPFHTTSTVIAADEMPSADAVTSAWPGRRPWVCR